MVYAWQFEMMKNGDRRFREELYSLNASKGAGLEDETVSGGNVRARAEDSQICDGEEWRQQRRAQRYSGRRCTPGRTLLAK